VMRVSNGDPIASVPNLRVDPGDQLLISGPSGAGKSCLLRAIAGIWPFGGGAVHLPAGSRVIALPQRRYFPLGTLRQALTYPTPADAVADADIREAMETVGIGSLAARLDERDDWSAVLSGGEQQRIGFARVLIHRPDIVLLDEAVSTLEDAEARELYRVLHERLPSAIVISIGRSAALADLHSRTFAMDGTPALARPPRRPAFAAAAT
jgi:vitamin B12/bleomycin/antimicrobial peptide transport system ATP-binding/permease protein